MHRLRLITLGIIIILFSIPLTVHAENNQTYEVSTDVVNVRSEPISNATIVGKLTKGNQVKVFDEHYGWVQTYYGGKEAWVAKHHLSPIGQSHDTYTSHSPTNTITIISDGVNIRSGPGEGYSVIDSVAIGDTYQLIHSEGDWHQIALPNGEKAWIASWLTDNNLSISTTSATNNLSGRHIVLDPGHGGQDPGAIGIQGIYEKDLTLSIAENVVHELRNAGATVTMTRESDFYVPLEKRAQISNTNQTDAFLSLHFNAFPIFTAQGISTFYYTGNGKNLAQHVQTSLHNSVALHSRGIKYADFHVLRNTIAPAILVELGFITNPHDSSYIQTNDYKHRVSRAITDGLIKYFN